MSPKQILEWMGFSPAIHLFSKHKRKEGQMTKSFDNLVDQIEEIEKQLADEDDWPFIDAQLQILSQISLNSNEFSNEELILLLRGTFMFRDKFPNWIPARNRVREILTNRNLDASKVLRGLE